MKKAVVKTLLQVGVLLLGSWVIVKAVEAEWYWSIALLIVVTGWLSGVGSQIVYKIDVPPEVMADFREYMADRMDSGEMSIVDDKAIDITTARSLTPEEVQEIKERYRKERGL